MTTSACTSPLKLLTSLSPKPMTLPSPLFCRWWCLCGTESAAGGKVKITLQATGNTSIKELLALLKDDQIQYATFRVMGVDERGAVVSRRKKFVHFQWIGPAVPRIKRANAMPLKNAAAGYFKGHHVTLELFDRQLDEVEVEKRLRACGGAHQPSRMEFARGSTISLVEGAGLTAADAEAAAKAAGSEAVSVSSAAAPAAAPASAPAAAPAHAAHRSPAAAGGAGAAASSSPAPAPAPAAATSAAPAVHVKISVGKGYEGFGSFHSDNVEGMLASAEAVNPSVPAGLAVSDFVPSGKAAPAFGSEAMKSQFLLDRSWTFLNHGGFGAALAPALQAAQKWEQYGESQPLRFIDRELFPLEVQALKAMAEQLGTAATSITFLPNTTYGLNVAVAAAGSAGGLSSGDVVFALDICYGATKKILAAAAEAVGAKLHVEPVPESALGSREALLAFVKGALSGLSSVKLAVFDHITSNTALRLPIAELTAAAHEAGALVLIDGAHGLQSEQLQLDTLGADWYVTAAHKWFCSPKGLAVLYASPAVKERTRARIISHGYGSGFNSEFLWDGARDYSGVLAVPTLLAWWKWVGAEAARSYCRELLQKAVALLVKEWGTGTFAGEELFVGGHMACVRLPEEHLPPAPEGGYTSAYGKAAQDALHYRHKIEVPVKTLNGQLYVRISAAVYNSPAEYQRLADTVKSWKWSAEGELL